MLEFIFGFLLGAFLGEYAVIFRKPHLSVMIACLLIFVIVVASRSWGRWYQNLCLQVSLCFGLFWGGFHNWREALREERGRDIGEVLRGNLQAKLGRHILVWQDLGTVVTARGAARLGDRGKLRCQSYRVWTEQVRCRFTVTVGMHYSRPNQWVLLSRTLAGGLRDRAQKFEQPWSGWTQALLLGDWSLLEPDIRQVFQRNGIVHLLVLSGFHISLVFMLVERLLFILLMPLYLFRVSSAVRWVEVSFLCFGLTIFFGLVFLLASGVAQPSLRAFLIYVIFRCGRCCLGGQSSEFWMVLALVGQMFVAPLGFLELSNLLSWLAYLWLICGVWSIKDPDKGGWQKIIELFLCQFGLSVLSFALLGVFPTIGIFTNLMVAPIFPLIFFFTILRVLLPELNWLVDLSTDLLNGFLWMIGKLAERSYILEIPDVISQWLTMLIISAFICYVFGWSVQQRRYLLAKRKADGE